MPKTIRMGLFIDAQNVYKGARDAFFPESADPLEGQFNPRKLAELIAERESTETKGCVVESVHIYTGYHTPERNRKSYASYRKQRAAWEADGCSVTARSLRYPNEPGQRPQEKGIDVALAIDYVRFSLDHAIDVAVLFSTDTDLLPAVEFVRDRCIPMTFPKVAAWNSRISVKELRPREVWCHRLTEQDYEVVRDHYDYSPQESVDDMADRLRRGLGNSPN